MVFSNKCCCLKLFLKPFGSGWLETLSLVLRSKTGKLWDCLLHSTSEAFKVLRWILFVLSTEKLKCKNVKSWFYDGLCEQLFPVFRLNSSLTVLIFTHMYREEVSGVDLLISLSARKQINQNSRQFLLISAKTSSAFFCHTLSNPVLYTQLLDW